MSKDFNGTTDLIDLGSPAVLDDVGGAPGPRTVTAMIFPQGWGGGSVGRIWDKEGVAGAGWIFLVDNITAAATIRCAIIGATSWDSTSAANTLSLNKWWFVASTWNGAVAPKLFVGDLASQAAEPAYFSQLTGTTYGSDAAENARIGNRATSDRGFDGLIAHVSVWNNELSLAQLRRLQRFPVAPGHRFTTAAAGALITCKGYWPSWESAADTARDLSGNGSHGTVTGTTVAPEPPVRLRRAGATQAMFTAAAGGAAVTYPQLERMNRGIERGILTGETR